MNDWLCKDCNGRWTGDVMSTCPYCAAARIPNRRAPPLAAPAPSAMATGEARVYGPTAEDRAKLRDTPAVVPATTGEAPVCATCNDTHKMALGERMAPCTACPVPCFNCRERDTAYCATPRCACPCHGTQSHATPPAAPAAVTDQVALDIWNRLKALGSHRSGVGVPIDDVRAAIQAALAAAAPAERGE